jgi:hypothetical protein
LTPLTNCIGSIKEVVSKKNSALNDSFFTMDTPRASVDGLFSAGRAL